MTVETESTSVLILHWLTVTVILSYSSLFEKKKKTCSSKTTYWDRQMSRYPGWVELSDFILRISSFFILLLMPKQHKTLPDNTEVYSNTRQTSGRISHQTIKNQRNMRQIMCCSVRKFIRVAAVPPCPYTNRWTNVQVSDRVSPAGVFATR